MFCIVNFKKSQVGLLNQGLAYINVIRETWYEKHKDPKIRS